MSFTGPQIRSLITEQAQLQLSLTEVEVPEPGVDEVVVEIQATPLNPSDLALLLGPADLTTMRTEIVDGQTALVADIPKGLMRMVQSRVGQSMAVGNEGAGLVVAAGSSDAAQALLGKTVAIVGGDMYSKYRCVNVFQAMPLVDGTTAAEGASSFVNPLTALGMVETMRAENHTALVHTAAASNLGQMLNRICQAEGIDLVNIVRKPEQEELLRDLGAGYVVNSSSDTFMQDLIAAVDATGATLAFDATGGGKLASQILTAMEAAAVKNMEYNRYGSDKYKQVYIYGGLDRTPTELTRAFGFAWGIGGWLLTPFLQKVGIEKMQTMQARVAAEIKTTFASNYTASISLEDVLKPEVAGQYSQQATGQKYLICP